MAKDKDKDQEEVKWPPPPQKDENAFYNVTEAREGKKGTILGTGAPQEDE